MTDKSLKPHWQQLSILVVQGQSNTTLPTAKTPMETNSGSASLNSEVAREQYTARKHR